MEELKLDPVTKIQSPWLLLIISSSLKCGLYTDVYTSKEVALALSEMRKKSNIISPHIFSYVPPFLGLKYPFCWKITQTIHNGSYNF